MKKLILILFIGLLGAQALCATDDLQTPEATIESVEVVSQPETLPEDLIIELDSSLVPEIVPQTPKKKSLYLWALKKLRDNVPAKLEKVFKKIHTPPELRDFIVKDLDQKLTQAPQIIESANGSGFSVRLLAMAGFGVTDYFRKVLSQKKWGRHLAKAASFGLALGAGIAVVSYERAGRRKVVVRLFADYERLDKVVNWMGEAIVGPAVGKISEEFSWQHEEAERKVLKEKIILPRSSLGPAGNMMMQDGYFEHSANLTLGGGLGMSSFYDLKVRQYRLSFLFDIQRIVDLKRTLAKSCRWIIGRD